MTNEQTLHALIDGVHSLGLGGQDLHAAEAMLDYREYGLAFELVMQQLHEHPIPLQGEQLALIESAASRLHIPAANFEFVQQQMR